MYYSNVPRGTGQFAEGKLNEIETVGFDEIGIDNSDEIKVFDFDEIIPAVWLLYHIIFKIRDFKKV